MCTCTWFRTRIFEFVWCECAYVCSHHNAVNQCKVARLSANLFFEYPNTHATNGGFGTKSSSSDPKYDKVEPQPNLVNTHTDAHAGWCKKKSWNFAQLHYINNLIRPQNWLWFVAVCVYACLFVGIFPHFPIDSNSTQNIVYVYGSL